MRKVDDKIASDTIQDFTGGLMKDAPTAIMMWFEPHSFEESSYRFRKVAMRRISGKIKDMETSLFPHVDSLGNLSFAVNEGIVKDNKSHLVDTFGKIVKPLCEHSSCNGIGGVNSLILAVRGHHSEYVESFLVFGWHEHIFVLELPTVRNVTTGAYMALIFEIEIDDFCTQKIRKFLQLMAFDLNKLRRECFPWTFSYTFISCANKSKKRLKVASLSSLCEPFCQATFAVLRRSRCCLTASLTARVSEDSKSSVQPYSRTEY